MEEIKQLDEKGLREFGLLTGTIIIALFGLLLPWLHRDSLPIWPWIVAGILWLLALLTPSLLNPIYLVWMKIGLVLGWINTRLILAIVFFALLTPIGLMMRGIFRQDPMSTKMELDQESYRIPSQVKARLTMERPF